MVKFKKVCCLLLCVVCVALAACSPSEQTVVENDRYKIYTKDGAYYFLFKDSDKSSAGQTDGAVKIPSVTFKTLAEMKNDILTCSFTESEWGEINRFAEWHPEFEICNLNALHAPIYPAPLDGYTVEWFFAFHRFLITDTDSQVLCHLEERPQEIIEMWAERLNNWTDYRVSQGYVDTHEDIRVEVETERNATSYYWPGGTCDEIKDCIYTIEKDNQVFYIREQYYLYSNNREPSAEIPRAIFLYCEGGNQSYCLSIYNPTERPSVEWLTSFGVVPYVEE